MPTLSPYKRYKYHRTKWEKCTKCSLRKVRKRVVLLRGVVPAEILFVGEAPGTSENVYGKPFIGPAGKLLDRILDEAGIEYGQYAITNLVGCIPLDDTRTKMGKPPEYAIKACRQRLIECINFCDPGLIVWVGQDAKKWGPGALLESGNANSREVSEVAIIHPAAILRMDQSQIGLAVQRTRVALMDAVEDMVPF